MLEVLLWNNGVWVFARKCALVRVWISVCLGACWNPSLTCLYEHQCWHCPRCFILLLSFEPWPLPVSYFPFSFLQEDSERYSRPTQRHTSVCIPLLLSSTISLCTFLSPSSDKSNFHFFEPWLDTLGTQVLESHNVSWLLFKWQWYLFPISQYTPRSNIQSILGYYLVCVDRQYFALYHIVCLLG